MGASFQVQMLSNLSRYAEPGVAAMRLTEGGNRVAQRLLVRLAAVFAFHRTARFGTLSPRLPGQVCLRPLQEDGHLLTPAAHVT
jgi:hypothetical protein